MKNTPLFTKGQRVAILILLTLVVCGVFVVLYFNNTSRPSLEYTQEAHQLQQAIEQFEASLYQKTENTYTHHKKGVHKADTIASSHYTLSHFNPNKADSLELIQLGLSPYVTRNILRYRAKGGTFRIAEDLGKIYGMTTEKMQELLPYIILPQDTIKQQRQYAASEKKDTIIELNKADTTSLQYLKGIGPVYARRILTYRNQLGGYHHMEQLREAITLSEEDYVYLAEHLTIDTTLIQPICVNTASVERLKRHPYIDFYVAKSIYNTRRNAFELNNITQLRGKEYLPDTTLKKLSPYLSFEKRNKISYKQ